jgi:hypothetical protein
MRQTQFNRVGQADFNLDGLNIEKTGDIYEISLSLNSVKRIGRIILSKKEKDELWKKLGRM